MLVFTDWLIKRKIDRKNNNKINNNNNFQRSLYNNTN